MLAPAQAPLDRSEGGQMTIFSQPVHTGSGVRAPAEARDHQATSQSRAETLELERLLEETEEAEVAGVELDNALPGEMARLQLGVETT